MLYSIDTVHCICSLLVIGVIITPLTCMKWGEQMQTGLCLNNYPIADQLIACLVMFSQWTQSLLCNPRTLQCCTFRSPWKPTLMTHLKEEKNSLFVAVLQNSQLITSFMRIPIWGQLPSGIRSIPFIPGIINFFFSIYNNTNELQKQHKEGHAYLAKRAHKGEQSALLASPQKRFNEFNHICRSKWWVKAWVELAWNMTESCR